MNNWLQNIKGQLTELATEVLNEATEEGQVSTGSELNVEKRRSTEAERLYLVEKMQKEELIKKLHELEEQLYSSNIENDAVKEKFMGIVLDRDQKIAQLNKEIESLRFDEQDKGEFRSISLIDTTMSSNQGGIDYMVNESLAELKEKHESEISAIMSANAQNIRQIKEQYEQRIRDLESWNILDEYTELLQNYDSLKFENDKQNTQMSKLIDNLEKSEQQISQLQIKIFKLQTELTHSKEIEQIKAKEIEALKSQRDKLVQSEEHTAELNRLNLKQITLLEAELKKSGDELQRLRNERLLVTSIQSSEDYKRPSSDTDESAVSNNEWERMCKDEIEVLGGSSNASEMSKNSPPNEYTAVVMEKKLQNASTQFDNMENDNKLIASEERIRQLENIVLEERNKIHILEEVKSFKSISEKSMEDVKKLDNELTIKQDYLTELEQKLYALESEYSKKNYSEQEYENKLAKLLERLDSVQLQLKSSLETNENLTTINAELTTENEQLKAEYGKLQLQENVLRESMQLEIDAKDEVILKARDQINFLEEALNGLKIENDLMQTNLAKIEKKLTREQAVQSEFDHEKLEKFSILMKEYDELKIFIQTKQEKCEEQNTKLQQFSKDTNDMKNQLNSERAKFLLREQEIEQKNERLGKLESELGRLREHLITIEDISAKEAIVAEEREVDLRQQIRQLQDRCNNDESNIAESTEKYQNEVMVLKMQLATIENERLQLQTALNDREDQLGESNKGLLNLQIVLKDLTEDHRIEKQQLTKKLDRTTKQLNDLLDRVAELSEKEQKMIKENESRKTEYDIEIHNLRTQLLDKESVIERLENQLEETGASDSKELDKTNSSNQSVNYSCIYKIDDLTLRQLFLSFFTADKSKQPEIAIVMSKILGYSVEEQELIQKALRSTISGSWFGFVMGTSQSGNIAQPSLTEQFIRFLENESLTAKAQPALAHVYCIFILIN